MKKQSAIKSFLVFAVLLSGCTSPFGAMDDRNANGTSTAISETRGVSTDLETTQSEHVRESNSVSTNQSNTPINEKTSSEATNSEVPTEWGRSAKYDYFRDNFTDSVKLAKVVESSIHPNNQSMSISYVIDKDDLKSTNNKTIDVIYAYAAMVDLYVSEGNYNTLDKSYVPKHVNVTAVSSEGEIYYTGFVKYEWAYNWKVSEEWPGDSDARRQRYVLEFFNTTDRGPAHPDYEEDPFDQ